MIENLKSFKMPAKPGLVKGSERDLDNQIEEDHLADLKA